MDQNKRGKKIEPSPRKGSITPSKFAEEFAAESITDAINKSYNQAGVSERRKED